MCLPQSCLDLGPLPSFPCLSVYENEELSLGSHDGELEGSWGAFMQSYCSFGAGLQRIASFRLGAL